MKLSEKLIKIRKEKGLSQEEFGNEINVSRQAVSKWENGETKPDIEKIREIVKKFNVSYNYLLDDEIENKEENKKIPEEENKKHKKKKKTVLKIVLIIILIYLLFCIYKFIAFYRFYLIANSFSEENYWVNLDFSYSSLNPISNSNTICSMEKVGNKLISESICFEEYDDILTDENGHAISNNISFIDSDKKESYSLSYNKDENAYTYHDDTEYLTDEEKEELFDLSKNIIKEITLGIIPSGFKEIFLDSINPLYYYVSIQDREIRAYSIKQETKIKITLNNDYLLKESYIKSEYNSVISITYSYDYVQDHFTEIQEPLEKYADKIVYEE